MLLLMTTVAVKCQVPYFAGTVGNNNVYVYTSLKVRPGINNQETYSTMQYGIGNSFSTGMDICTAPNQTYWGALVRYGTKISKWFNVGAQVTPSFSLNDNFKFSYLTSALYMNGNITKKGGVFWCTNTWYGVNKEVDNTITQWAYLGKSFSLKNGDSITSMVGTIYSWKFNQDADITAGFYYSRGKTNIYLWGNNFLKDNPRIVAGIDFIF